MKYHAVSWEGSLMGPETLEKLAEEALPGQRPGDFGFAGRVREEILEAWASARAQWELFKVRRDRDDIKDKYGTSRTRQFWIQPLLALLGYDLQNAPAVEIGGRGFPISHRANGRICPVHAVGCFESLDRKREGSKASPHSMTQEYVNLSEALFALLTNGLQLRLVRDSSRLIKLSYLEFNLERIFEEKLFADFALLFRLLHITRWARDGENPAESLLETYHQDSLENGSRIREKLSEAVVGALETWAEGLLLHQDNEAFRRAFGKGRWTPRELYDQLLTLVYRILFLLVIEERDLTYPPEAPNDLKEIYRRYYSLSALRRRCRSVWKEEERFSDLWATLLACFSLHENEKSAAELGLKPLAGDLFSPESFSLLRPLSMDNRRFAQGMNRLDAYRDERLGAVRVNYAALNVEEFGSVYEGLLDLDAEIDDSGDRLRFRFVRGNDRGKSGSHYTPEELVQPLLEHALEPLIRKATKEPDAEDRLLNLRICDDACGSGHILLNAARRVALEVARVRTGADNPDPAAYRQALRDVIEGCIYGVDSNPQAVRLCKVALWLESHNPGKPLGFLDHRIKCGDSLVGIARASQLLDDIPDEAYKTREGDDPEFCAKLRGNNAQERLRPGQMEIDWETTVGKSLKDVVNALRGVAAMDASTPEGAERKKDAYLRATGNENWRHLKALADVKLAAFFLSKRPETSIVTQRLYRLFLDGTETLDGHPAADAASSVAGERRFFHWFLEFADAMMSGGFDCFLGNPPFLGGQRLSGAFGKEYLAYLKSAYAPAGAIDLVGYFVRRNYDLLKEDRSLGTLATNTLAQGSTREGGLDVIEKAGGTLVMAVRSRPWPGAAAVAVSQAVIRKGTWSGKRVLDGKPVAYISTYFDDQKSEGAPFRLEANAEKSFIGSYVLGMGFILEPEEAVNLIERNPANKDVLFPYLNGEDLNGRSDQSPSRRVINFRDWPLDRESAPDGYKGPVATDYPDCLEIVERLVKPERDKLWKGDITARDRARRWWQFARQTMNLYRTIAPLERVMVSARVTKTPVFSLADKNFIYSEMTVVLAFDDHSSFSLMNSSFQEFWAWKNASTLGSTMRYTPSDIFETFPFPPGFEPSSEGSPSASAQPLDELGKGLHEGRRALTTKLDIGLTSLYNLYHAPDLSIGSVEKAAKRSGDKASHAREEIEELRRLHRRIDEAVREAYGWSDIPLEHGFHELEFLPENDRVRYTVSRAARREILERLLKLNHRRHDEEIAAGLVGKDGKTTRKKARAKKRKRTPAVEEGQWLPF
ncbi:N-6 DNA methylase [Aminithiophilus ramosus]|uniref:site-specific DNA-methyltransferase (adenine-specific) n=2 Tax=Synergistales TaxID=649776 RepID=A0A9Q7EV99_9BACT|nr:N-6 DNA methylase [Aminithiophilus ramosus]QTX31824.1 N-6 DNA methylase [Aminithiophilus ramosus]QVL35648.1 N-6 DNA methylase [Synergistota bacterium]